MTAEQTNEKDNLEVDSKLLEILVCPVSHGQLRYDRDAQESVSYTHLTLPTNREV